MDTSQTHHPASAALDRLIAFDADGRAIWPADDLRDTLRRQLRSHLLWQLRQPDPAHQRLLATLTHSTQYPLESFHDLLHHPRPPIELLRLTKDFAKLNHVDPSSLVPPEVSLLLYYGCIIVALLRCNQRISKLADDDLRNGLNWAVKQPWADQETRSLFREGLTLLRSGLHLWRK